jgi:maltooligosyltrehalose trehalohydrolase
MEPRVPKKASSKMSGRTCPVGAEINAGGTSFRVWAPDRAHVWVALDDGTEHRLEAEADGYFSALLPVPAGARYRFRLDGDDRLYPDPASRFQPEGPHGPSQVVDPRAYRWRDADWRGVSLEGQVVYEMHVGAFTPEGTWRTAAEKLPLLKDVGVTLIEMMPAADFPGSFGWGYDGVNLFAPTRLYGYPDDLRALIDAAHGLGLGVILDVVYNHLGPDGNYLSAFAKSYFTDRYANEWGEAVNFDGPDAGPVREFYLANAAYWISEFHFDGLRLDATQSIHDSSDHNIIAEIGDVARNAAGKRRIVLIAENEPQHSFFARAREEGGYGLDALWNDDLHHSAMVALTGRHEAYYEDHLGAPQEFISAAKYGYLFQGQVYAHQKQRRGRAGLDLKPAAFVNFVQNHDQIANSARGQRFHLLTSPGRARAMTAYLLLAPGTPMLFMGQEFGASTPFLYFADHKPELAKMVHEGRRDFMRQFESVAEPAVNAQLASADARSTYEASVLDWAEFDSNAHVVALHRDLLRLRREDPVFATQRRGGLDGAVLGPEAFVLRFIGDDGDDRLLLVNLGRDIVRSSFPEPLLAPPEDSAWRTVWSSEDLAYGGSGAPPVETDARWRLPGHAAIVFASSR